MKPNLTQREKVLLCILAVLVIFSAYYLMFWIPTSEEIGSTESAIVTVEDTLLAADTKAQRMREMERELEEIFSQQDGSVKELPPYDNSGNLMRHLNGILSSVSEYDITFSSVSTEDSIVRRDINMDFTCGSYELAKAILKSIHDGEYRCLIKDLVLTQNDEDGYRVSVNITYYEYIEAENDSDGA